MNETVRGRGTLDLRDRTYKVDYELSGDRGKLHGLSPGDADFAKVEDESVRLVIEDGRSVRIVVENQEGDFRAIAPATAKGSENASR
jgi:hypothetical protein